MRRHSAARELRRAAACAVLLAATVGARRVAAQAIADSGLRIGRVHHLQSAALGERREYFVYEPPGTHGRPLPAIVVLDGEAHFLHTLSTTVFLAQQRRMPQVRVIGIANGRDRLRDFTPLPLDSAQRREFPTAGGADSTLRFLADEVLPAVQRDYGPVPMRILTGHSLGGLIAAHALVARPALFQGYVMVSPSLWFDGFRYADTLASRARSDPAAQPWIYATVGGLEPRVQLEPFARVAAAMAGARPAVAWHFEVLAAEDHGSTPLRTTYAALEALFARFTLADSGRTVGIAGVDRHYDELRRRFHYPDHTPEAALNALGYALLLRGSDPGRREAIEVFRENTRRFPASANTYDSLADAMRAAGRREEAMTCYARAVVLGRTMPTGGESFANALIVPNATAKLAAVAADLGRPPWTDDEMRLRMGECR